MTNKTRNWIIGIGFALTELLIFGGLVYVMKYHYEELWWVGGLAALEVILLAGFMYVLPRFLDMRVENRHNCPVIHERIIVNAKEKAWISIVCLILFFIIFTFVLSYIDTFDHPNWTFHKHIIHVLVQMVFFFVLMSPIYGDQIHRCIKNTYTIEGGNLIINEWAYFRRKTKDLVVPIAEIESIRKKTHGIFQACNLEIEVGGIKRVLTSGMAGDQLYDELKRRMA